MDNVTPTLGNGVFVPALLSFVMVGLLWQYIYDPTFGLLNRALGTLGITDGHTTWLASAHLSLMSVMVVEVWKWVGYHTVLFLAGLSLVSSDLREAARIDGANAVSRFWHVMLPAIRGVFIVNVTKHRQVRHRLGAHLSALTQRAAQIHRFVITLLALFIHMRPPDFHYMNFPTTTRHSQQHS